MLQYDITFILVHFSSVFTVSLLYLILRYKKKTQMHYIFLSLISLLTLWNISTLLEEYIKVFMNYDGMLFVYTSYLSICFIPVCVLALGHTYANTKTILSAKHALFLVIPFISTIVIWTNDRHHLFFMKYSTLSQEAVYGPYYYFHSIYSYGLILIGLVFLFASSLKNSGFFSKQSKLILLGLAVPLCINVLFSFNIISLPFRINSVAFTVASGCFAIAILKFHFLKISPIALKAVVDRISDSFLVVNEDYQIIDFNEPMAATFKDLFTVSRSVNLGQILEKTTLGPDGGRSLLDCIEEVKKSGNSLAYDKHMIKENFDRHFTIEITPIISRQNYLGTIILFKDITQNIRAIETIEEKHAIMMEQERLASLGQLIGGIAHNLKTPIMSISGAVEGLRDLVSEYKQSIGDSSVTESDHREIAQEMHTWLNKIKPYCSYMTDIIDTVKGQTLQSSTSSMLGFTVNELAKRIELLLKYELIRHKCRMNTVLNLDIYTELHGDINSLIQVFDNIIINAIQSYDGKSGVIDFTVMQQENDILFEIRDYGKGIPETIKDRLLKEMVTTKGRNGTGLGLYMSNSTIKGRFRGKMWFESVRGRGTTFYVSLPHRKQGTIAVQEI